MRIRTVLCATALTTVAAFPLAGVAAAQQPTDRDCRDFASQAAAQSALHSRSGDPARLDANHDGTACEEYFKLAQRPDGEPRPEPGPDGERPAPGPDGERPAPPARPVVDRDPEPGVVVPPPGAPEHARVRTVPEHQILVRPHGAPDTGDGSAAAPDPTGSDLVPVVLLAGGLGVVGAALVVRRRAARR
jgi:hypothetical protein